MKIKDVCVYAPKSNIKAGEATTDGRYMFFTSSEDESKRYKEYQFDCEGIVMGTGGNATLHYYNGKFAVSTDCVVLFPNKQIRCKYLYYYFLANISILEAGFKGAGLKHTNKGYIGNIEIQNIPSLEEQDNIINVLNHVFAMISSRSKEKDLLNDLIKARFVEMFGDCKINPNSYEIVKFEDCIEYIGDIGSNGSNSVVVEHLDMKDEQDYALMIRFLNFTKNDFTDDVKYVSKEAYDFFKKSQIFGGELIICKIGSAGQNYVMPYLNRPVSLGLNQIMVRINKKVLMPYFYNYLHTEYGQMLIDGCINGAVTKSITKTELKKIPVLLPPIKLQEQFAAFAERIDKSKNVIKKSLEKLELLKKALMQKYFG